MLKAKVNIQVLKVDRRLITLYINPWVVYSLRAYSVCWVVRLNFDYNGTSI